MKNFPMSWKHSVIIMSLLFSLLTISYLKFWFLSPWDKRPMFWEQACGRKSRHHNSKVLGAATKSSCGETSCGNSYHSTMENCWGDVKGSKPLFHPRASSRWCLSLSYASSVPSPHSHHENQSQGFGRRHQEQISTNYKFASQSPEIVAKSSPTVPIHSSNHLPTCWSWAGSRKGLGPFPDRTGHWLRSPNTVEWKYFLWNYWWK